MTTHNKRNSAYAEKLSVADFDRSQNEDEHIQERN